jgi:Ca2+-binding RTX toxin-like protein
VGYALTLSNRLVVFNVNAPGTLIRNLPVTGLQPGEDLVGIDVRPATFACGYRQLDHRRPNKTNNTDTETTRTPACTISGSGNILGTQGNDVICGSAAADNIAAQGGNDIIFAGAGADLIDAGLGNDTVFAGPGDDRIAGNIGTDKATAGTGFDRCSSVETNDCERSG